MRWLLALSLLPLAVGAASAQENEAEKLFRGMEKKVRAAKTLRLRFDLRITDAEGKKGNAKGSLILGTGDKFRAEAEGKLFGEAVKFTVVSDGTRMKASGGPGGPKGDKAQKSPRGSGAYFRGTLPREGFFVSSLNQDRRGGRGADLLTLSDFQLAGKEKVAGRDTRVIRYTVKEKGKNPLAMKVWLDAKTNLPVKLAGTGGKTDITDFTETYREFTLDAEVDPKSFELPK